MKSIVTKLVNSLAVISSNPTFKRKAILSVAVIAIVSGGYDSSAPYQQWMAKMSETVNIDGQQISVAQISERMLEAKDGSLIFRSGDGKTGIMFPNGAVKFLAKNEGISTRGRTLEVVPSWTLMAAVDQRGDKCIKGATGANFICLKQEIDS